MEERTELEIWASALLRVIVIGISVMNATDTPEMPSKKWYWRLPGYGSGICSFSPITLGNTQRPEPVSRSTPLSPYV